MFAAYRAACETGALQPGGLHVYQAPDRFILNLAMQRGIGRRSARLEWVRSAACQLTQLSLEGLTVPRIGAGLGGLP